MDHMQQLQRLFAYDGWANREALASLVASSSPPPPALRFLAHIVACEQLWWGRIQQDKKRVAVWPELTLAECEAGVDELAQRWPLYLAALAPEQLSQRVPYRNTKGESWANTLEDILLHVVIHSAYHRGQIATAVRAAGHTPAYTDFIHCVRQGSIK